MRDRTERDADDGLARLSPATLAQFEGGLSWHFILGLTHTHGLGKTSTTAAAHRKWWTAAITDAEERGLLKWTPKRAREPGRWHLTPMGRELVRAAAVIGGCA